MGYLVLEDAPDRSYGHYSIRSVRPGDAEPIRLWRNAQIAVLRQERPLSYEDQQVYFCREVRPDFYAAAPRQILLTLLRDEQRVGYGGLTHVNWEARRAELSFLADPERSESYADDCYAFLRLVHPIAFADLDLHRLWHETFSGRKIHVQTLEEFGFDREGRLRDHIYHEGNYYDGLIYGIVSE